MSDNYERILNVLKDYEKFEPKAHWDVSQYSIGYGTRTDDPDEISGKVVINEAEASKRLSDWVGKDRAYIQAAGEEQGLSWSGDELDALTSFTYNLGRGNFNKLIDGRDKATIADKMLEYNKAGGEELEGLNIRRNKEREMFLGNGKVASSAVADRSYLNYSETTIPTSILRETPTENPEGASIGEVWEAATYRHWLDNSMTRQIDAESGEWNRDYSVSMEQLQKFNDKGYSQGELGFLSQATSESNMAHRIGRIEADRKAKAVIEQGGVTGTGVEMLASIADPTLLPTIFLGGTAAAAGKWSSAKAIGMSMLSGASQNAAVEYMLKMGDTQRTDEEVMLAMAGGALFSGTITAGAIGYRSHRTRLAQANQVEAAHIAGVKDQMNGVAAAKADEALAVDIPDPAARKRVMTEKEIIGKMQEEVGTRQDALSSKKIKAAKEEFRAYKKSRAEMLEKIANKRIRPSAKIKESKLIEDAIAVREAKLNDLIAQNNAKLETNSQLDALQQGHVPKSLQNRYMELKKEFGEFDIEVKGFQNTKPKPKPVEEEPAKPVEGEGGTEARESIGAMQTARPFSDIKTGDRLLTETDVDKIWEAVEDAEILGINTPRVSRLASHAKGFRSTSTIVDSAPDAATRGLGIKLLKNGTRTIKGHQSVEEFAETMFFRNTPDYLDHERAFDDYAKARGLHPLKRGYTAAREEFDKEVVLAQASGAITDNAAKASDDPVTRAAKLRSRIYERGLKLNKDGGVIGFDKINHTHNYHSVVYSADNILSQATTGKHRDFIRDTIAKSYQQGGIKLTRENAVRLADTQLARTFAYRHGESGSFKTVMSDAEFKLLDKELKDKGVDATTREELKASLFNKEELANMSPRAMFSLRPDLTASSGGIRMVDLVDTSIDRVMKYASDASANYGLARNGFQSRNQFLRAMEEARSRAINDLTIDAASDNPKIRAAAQEQLALANKGYHQGLMEDALKLIYREPLQGIGNDTIEDLSKILRKQTSITRLRATGFMSIPENAIAMARNGALNTIAQIPKTRYFNLMQKSVEKDEFMKQFANTFSATGHQEYLFGAKFYNNSDFDDATKGKIMNAVNKLQGKMMDVTMTVNAFRTFQHGGEEMVARSIVSNIKDLAKKGEITPNIRKSLIDVGGLSDAQVTQMIDHFNKHPDIDVFDSVRMMDSELYNSVSVAVRNTIGSSFMRIGIGESVPYANRELGKIMTSLLNFSIGSWEKMVVRGVKTDGPALMASMFAGQAGLALLSQYAYVYSRAAAMEKQERQKYIEKNMNDEALFWGVFNRVGYLAAPALPLQMLAAARLLPDEISASPTKAGISQAGIPSVSMGQDVFKAAGSAGELISDKFNNEYMSNKDRERNWKNIRRVLPWIDSPVYNFTIGQLD